MRYHSQCRWWSGLLLGLSAGAVGWWHLGPARDQQAALLASRPLAISIPLSAGVAPAAASVEVTSARLPAARAEALRTVRQQQVTLPITFEPNVGQSDERVRYIGRAPGYMLFLRDDDVLIRLPGRVAAGGPEEPIANRKGITGESLTGAHQHDVVRMRFAGGAPTATLVEEPQHVRLHYYRGPDPAQWQTNVATFARARYTNMYPGVDVVFYGNGAELEYDLVVAPGADPSIVRVAFDGLTRMELEAGGDLVLHTASSQLRQRKPVLYQEIDGRRVAVDGEYTVHDEAPNEIGFRVGAYDTSQPLVIDPILVTFSGLLGGSGTDTLTSVDVRGSRIVAGGTTSSTQFAGRPGSTTSTADLMVLDFTQSGGVPTLERVTVLAGNTTEVMSAVKIDASGNVFGLGTTNSSNMPIAGTPFQSTYGTAIDAYLFKLTADGTLAAAGYFGGSGTDLGNDLALDPSGNPVVVMTTASSNLATPGAFQTTRTGTAALVAYVSADLATKRYATYLGGSNYDGANKVDVSAAGRVAVAGLTYSPNFPIVGASQAYAGNSDAFLAVFLIEGQALTIELSRLIGDSGFDNGTAVVFSNGISPPAASPSSEPSAQDGVVTLCEVGNGRQVAVADLMLLCFFPIPGEVFFVREEETLDYSSIAITGFHVTETDVVISGTTTEPVLAGTSQKLQSTGVSIASNLTGTPTVTPVTDLPLGVHTTAAAWGGDTGYIVIRSPSDPNGYDVIAGLDPTTASQLFMSPPFTGGGISNITNVRNPAVPSDQLLAATNNGLWTWQKKLDGSLEPPLQVAGTGGNDFLTVSDPVLLGGQNFIFVTTPEGWQPIGQNPDGTFNVRPLVPTRGTWPHIDVASQNGLDALLAIGGIANSTDTIEIWLFSPSAGATPLKIENLGAEVGGLAWGHYNADGALDLFATGYESLKVLVSPFASPASFVTFGAGPIVTFEQEGATRSSFITGDGAGIINTANPDSTGGYTFRSGRCGASGPGGIRLNPADDALTSADQALLINCYSSGAFVTRVPFDGGPLTSVLIDGPGNDAALAVDFFDFVGGTTAEDTAGEPYVVVGRASSGFPVTNGSAYAGGAADAFMSILTVVPNSAPTISDVANVTIGEGSTTGAIAFTIGDAETPESLTVTATLSNATLVPASAIVLGGSGANRTITLTPAAGQFGTALITLTVSDGELTASDTFTLTVTEVLRARNLRASITGSSVGLFWDPPTQLAVVLGYLVDVGSVSGAANLASLPTPATSLSAGGVPDGIYYVRVRVVTAAGAGAASNEVVLRVPAPPCSAPPGSPLALTATVNGTLVQISWTPPASGDAPTTYVIYAGTSSGAADIGTFTIAASSTGASGNLPNGTYFFRVAASNPCGTSGVSNEASVTVGATPIAPGIPGTPVATVAGARVTVQWTAPATGGPVSNYILEVVDEGGNVLFAVDTANAALTLVADGVPPGQYRIRLRAANAGGVSAPTPVVIVTVAP